jgi:DNA-directed RNA polymerase specialized sigma24 family protein
MGNLGQDSTAPGRAQFDNTHWSVVLLAGQSGSPLCEAALENLCASYWYPLYAFLKRQGYAPADAKDLTQEFFSKFLQKNFLSSVNPARGKFRSFLLAALKHFLANEWDRAHAQKRGGKHSFVSIDEQTAEGRYQVEQFSTITPEELYDRQWALTVFDETFRALKAEWEADGKTAQFEKLHVYLSSEPAEGAYATIAGRLQMSNGAVAVEVHRLRKRYGELLRKEIGRTVSTPAEIPEEMRFLCSVFNR